MKLLLIALALYALGFVGTFWVNARAGNIELPLVILRAILWPYFWITGGPG